MTTLIVIVALASLIGIFIARNRISTATGISQDTITRACVMLLFCLIAVTGFRSCAGGTPTTGAGSGVGNGLWILIGIGLVISAIVTRAHGQLPYIFSAGAGAVLIALFGEFDSLFSWGVIGLPFFAAIGIWGSIKTEGRTRSFLGFASGITILFWMYMFYQKNPIENIGFLKLFFPDETQKGIAVLFILTLVFAVWMKSGFKSFLGYTAAFIIFLCLLGGAVGNNKKSFFDEMLDRFPEKLTPSIPTNGAVGKLSGAVGKMADAYASKVDANATKEIAVARQHSQIQKIWRLPIGTKTYDNNNGVLIPLQLKYEKEVTAISQNNPIDLNGAIYEEVSVPDPTTGEQGKLVVWVFSLDLGELIKNTLDVEKNNLPPASTEPPETSSGGEFERGRELSKIGVMM